MRRLALEGKGLRSNRRKTRYIQQEFGQREEVDEMRSAITIKEDEVSEVESSKYLSSFVQKNEGFDEDKNIGLSACG